MSGEYWIDPKEEAPEDLPLDIHETFQSDAGLNTLKKKKAFHKLIPREYIA